MTNCPPFDGRRLVGTLLLALAFFSETKSLRAQISPIWMPPGEERFYFEGLSQNFFTESNYTRAGGEYELLPNDGSLFSSQNRLGAGYSLNSGIQLRGALISTYASIKNNLTEESDFNFSGLELGLVLPLLKNENYKLFWNFLGRVNLDSVEGDRAAPLGHAGTHALQTHFRLERSGKFLSFFTDQGLDYPMEGLATLWTWALGAQIHLRQMTVTGQLEGQSTLLEDEYTDNSTQRTDLTDRFNTGSLAFYSLNPQRLNFRAIALVKLSEQLSIPLSFMKTLNGASAAEGFELTAGVRWALGPEGPRPQRRVRPVRDKDFEVDRGRPSERDVKYGPDGEPLKDTEQLLEERIQRRQ